VGQEAKRYEVFVFNIELKVKFVKLIHCGPVTQICVFKLQLRKTDDANLRF